MEPEICVLNNEEQKFWQKVFVKAFQRKRGWQEACLFADNALEQVRKRKSDSTLYKDQQMAIANILDYLDRPDNKEHSYAIRPGDVALLRKLRYKGE